MQPLATGANELVDSRGPTIGAAGSWLWRNGKELWNFSKEKDGLISQRENDLKDCYSKYAC
jgi:hypothetical protein